MITAREIDQQLTAALKMFGTYQYYDKGAREIMDLDPIIQSFKASEDPAAVLAVLAELDKKKRNDLLVKDLVCSMDDWDASYADEMFGSGHPVITKYY